MPTAVGQAERVSVTFTDPSLVTPSNPTGAFDPVTVRLRYSGPAVASTLRTYPTDPIVKDAIGQYHYLIPTTAGGVWNYRWEGLDAGANLVQAFDGTFGVAPSPFVAQPSTWPSGYPYQYGYASVEDVLARIKSAGYDPSIPGNVGNVAVNNAIQEASADMDLVLGRAGYWIPLAPLSSPPGTVIAPQVWTHLRNVCATLATGQVEMFRHAEDGTANDTQAERMLKLGDDLLARLETGAVNFKLFGVGGGFEMEADPAGSMSTDATEPDLITGNIPVPMFTIPQGSQSDWPYTADPARNPW